MQPKSRQDYDDAVASQITVNIPTAFRTHCTIHLLEVVRIPRFFRCVPHNVSNTTLSSHVVRAADCPNVNRTR